MTIPFDISACANQTCEVRFNCRRPQAPGRVYSNFPGGADCYGFIGQDRRKHEAVEALRAELAVGKDDPVTAKYRPMPDIDQYTAPKKEM